MQAWTNLARLALIGTEHQPPTQAALGDGSLDGVLAGFGPVEERESYLLKTGAALTLAKRAGYKPGVKASALAVAPPEVQPRCPSAAGQDLARMLRDYLPQVLPDWLELAEKLGVRAPEDSLPELFDYARGKTHLRAKVRAVAGQRGAWLAAQNNAWSFAISAGGDEKAWHEGKRAERIAALREIRQANPARARELLAESWKKEAPEDRAEFVQALQINYSMDDEAFLESALDDKRKEVRGHLLAILGGLPQSKFVQRMTQLTTPLIQYKKQLLRGGTIEVTLPTEVTKEMSRYGVGVSRPEPKGLGEKASWLVYMLEMTPPSHWCSLFAVSPKQLIIAGAKSEWAEVLGWGWSMAAARFDDGNWIAAWLDAASENKALQAYLPRLATCDFRGADREAALVKLLRMNLEPAHQHIVPAQLLRTPGPWGEALSAAVLEELRTGLNLSPTDYFLRTNWQQLMKAAALQLPLTLSQTTSMWPSEFGQPSLREAVDEFCAVIEFRRSMHRHFKGEK